jgi:AcrR family transcriptional regulator
MAARKYEKNKRAAAMEETRQKIIEATFSLHGEKGIMATGIKDIATRADVGIGTVYYHFPTYNDVVRACGEYSMAMLPFPSPDIFDNVEAVEERVKLLVQNLFILHSQFPDFAEIRVDRNKLPAIEEGVKEIEAFHEKLVRKALEPFVSPEKEKIIPTIIALTDVVVFRILTSNDLTVDEATHQISQVLLAWLKSQQD